MAERVVEKLVNLFRGPGPGRFCFVCQEPGRSERWILVSHDATSWPAHGGKGETLLRKGMKKSIYDGLTSH